MAGVRSRAGRRNDRRLQTLFRRATRQTVECRGNRSGFGGRDRWPGVPVCGRPASHGHIPEEIERRPEALHRRQKGEIQDDRRRKLLLAARDAAVAPVFPCATGAVVHTVRIGPAHGAGTLDAGNCRRAKDGEWQDSIGQEVKGHGDEYATGTRALPMPAARGSCSVVVHKGSRLRLLALGPEHALPSRIRTSAV